MEPVQTSQERMGTAGSQWPPDTYVTSQLDEKPPELPDLFTLIGLNVGVVGTWRLQREGRSGQMRG